MIPADLCDALRLGYPTGKYVEVSLSRLEAGLSHHDLVTIGADLERSGLVTTHVDSLQHPDDRSRLIVVGLVSCPLWGEFIAMPVQDRVVAIQEAGQVLHYLKAYVSRLGPFWIPEWNGFGVAGNTTTIEQRPPTSTEWNLASSLVDATLQERGFSKLPENVLSEPVAWLDPSGAWTLRSVENGGSPTV